MKNLQDTRLTAEVSSITELNKYLNEGWVLILSYIKNSNGAHQPRFVVAWQKEGPAVHPEILDEWEQREMMRQQRR